MSQRPRMQGGLRAAASLAWVALALSVALAGCPKPKSDPEESLRAFFKDLRAGNAEAAWNQLSEGTQVELKKKHEALARAVGKNDEAKPSKMLFDELGLMMLNPPESIAMTSPPGPAVTLRVTVKGGETADVHMVREGASWKVDLVGSLKKAPPLDKNLGRQETETSTTP